MVRLLPGGRPTAAPSVREPAATIRRRGTDTAWLSGPCARVTRRPVHVVVAPNAGGRFRSTVGFLASGSIDEGGGRSRKAVGVRGDGTPGEASVCPCHFSHLADARVHSGSEPGFREGLGVRARGHCCNSKCHHPRGTHCRRLPALIDSTPARGLSRTLTASPIRQPCKLPASRARPNGLAKKAGSVAFSPGSAPRQKRISRSRPCRLGQKLHIG